MKKIDIVAENIVERHKFWQTNANKRQLEWQE